MSPGRISIYHFMPDAVFPGSAAICLTSEEKSRAGSFRFPSDAMRWSACRAILRRILGTWIGLPPLDVPLVLSPHGKPLLAPPFDSIHFNLSHCDGLALIAISRGGPVGIDVEPLNRASSLIGCEATFCHPGEIADLPSDEPSRADELLRIWTAKEAYVKALGTGFSTPPESIRILTRQNGTLALGPECGSPTVRLHHPALIRYLAHVCALQPVGELEIVWEPEMGTEAATTG